MEAVVGTVILIGAIVWLMCGITAAVIAHGKRRLAPVWFAIGLLTGVFGLIMIACLPALQTIPVRMRGETSLNLRREIEALRKQIDSDQDRVIQEMESHAR